VQPLPELLKIPKYKIAIIFNSSDIYVYTYITNFMKF